jgi:hypothetical protein
MPFQWPAAFPSAAFSRKINFPQVMSQDVKYSVSACHPLCAKWSTAPDPTAFNFKLIRGPAHSAPPSQAHFAPVRR